MTNFRDGDVTCPKPIFDICINQNATFKMTLRLTDASGSPVDATSWSFSGSVLERFVPPGNVPLQLFFTASLTDATQSMVTVTLSSDQTQQLSRLSPTNEGRNFTYDVIAVNYAVKPDEVYRILQGRARINDGSTIPPPER